MCNILTKVLSVLLVTTAFSGKAFSATDPRPNILVIMADDLGYADLGFTGAKDIFTPNLDALANNGVIMNNGYVTHPVCGPSRAGLITGRYQARFGMEINVTNSFYDEFSGLPLTEQTFATRLKKSGYETGIVGKWHLGGNQKYHPHNRGFDYFFGFLAGGHTYFPKNVTTTTPLWSEKNPKQTHYSANEGSIWPLQRNDNTAEFTEYLTTQLSRDAAKFVSDAEKPFMLYLAYNAPHLPLEAPAATIKKYSHIKNKTRQIYAAMVDEMDRGIGMVVDSLKASGKFDNTLIFFLSDNGAAAPLSGMDYKKKKKGKLFSDSGKFRDGKGSMREGGSHVPFIMHWPAGIKKSGEFDGLVSSLDIAATAVALGKGDTSGHKLEGKNLIPYVNGDKQGSPHSALFWRREAKQWAVRTLDAKYLMNAKDQGIELYDMQNDPYEKNNILKNNPAKRKELAKLWNEWNDGNSNNILLDAGNYQKVRLNFYRDLHKELVEKSKKVKKVVID
ncbi:sulfatase family protein [Paraglaciecola sp.]|uniref:sulfatase family protein n=1 Tax=Paraglaciecola sp. TaxID=1920173 RepID=UPI003EF3CF0D